MLEAREAVEGLGSSGAAGSRAKLRSVSAGMSVARVKAVRAERCARVWPRGAHVAGGPEGQKPEGQARPELKTAPMARPGLGRPRTPPTEGGELEHDEEDEDALSPVPVSEAM